MSFAGLNKLHELLNEFSKDPNRFMAKQEIVKRTANIFRIFQWRYCLKHEIEIPWPSGWTPQDHLGNSSQSSDPNEWYREWLEKNVGSQGWAWDWRIAEPVPNENADGTINETRLTLRFRKESAAVLFTLKYR